MIRDSVVRGFARGGESNQFDWGLRNPVYMKTQLLQPLLFRFTFCVYSDCSVPKRVSLFYTRPRLFSSGHHRFLTLYTPKQLIPSNRGIAGAPTAAHHAFLIAQIPSGTLSLDTTPFQCQRCHCFAVHHAQEISKSPKLRLQERSCSQYAHCQPSTQASEDSDSDH